jgi:outer membrane biosynthesis protein TonB
MPGEPAPVPEEVPRVLEEGWPTTIPAFRGPELGSGPPSRVLEVSVGAVAPMGANGSSAVASEAEPPEASAAPVPPEVAPEDHFFETPVAEGVRADVAVGREELEPAEHGSNWVFIVVAGVVALAVGFFLVYLFLSRDRPEVMRPAPSESSLATSKTQGPARGVEAPSLPTPAPREVAPAPAAPADAGPTVSVSQATAALRPEAQPESADEPEIEMELLKEAEVEVEKPRPKPVQARRPDRGVKPQEEVVRRPEAPPRRVPAPAPGPEDGNRALAQARFRAGQALLMEGNFQAAAGEFHEALKLHGGIAEAHRGLGVAYSALQRKAEAIRHYEAYLRARPKASDREAVQEALQDLRK